MDSKIAPLLERFERAISNEKLAQIHEPTIDSVSTKSQSSAVSKSQSRDSSPHEKTTTFPKSHSSDLVLSTSCTDAEALKLQDTDPPKTQFPKSHSSTALKNQKSIMPKSRSSAAVLKSQKSFLHKQDQSTSKQDSSPSPKKDSSTSKPPSKSTSKQDSSSSLKKDSTTSKPPSKTWKPKNSKLQALVQLRLRDERERS